MKLRLKHEGGITLIALIITIIIIVILAAVSVNSIYNMGIVDKATQGVQQYAQRAVEENQMMDSTTRVVGDTAKRLEALQGKVPEELQRYVMGADGTGRAIGDIFTGYPSYELKNDTSSIQDASTSVILMNLMDDANKVIGNYNYYLYVKYQNIGYKIIVTKNASTNNAEKTTGVEVVYVPNGMEGQIIENFKAKTTDEEGMDWLVIYDNGDTVDMIPIILENSWTYTLGNTDSAAVMALPSGTKVQKAEYSRVHMSDTLNTYCGTIVTNPCVKRVRSIGTQFDIVDTTEKYSSTRLTTWPKGADKGKYNGVGLVGDMNAEQDVVRMSFFSPGETYQKYGYAKADVKYYLASRYIRDNVSFANVCFGLRFVDANR